MTVLGNFFVSPQTHVPEYPEPWPSPGIVTSLQTFVLCCQPCSRGNKRSTYQMRAASRPKHLPFFFLAPCCIGARYPRTRFEARRRRRTRRPWYRILRRSKGGVATHLEIQLRPPAVNIIIWTTVESRSVAHARNLHMTTAFFWHVHSSCRHRVAP
jgi:hypothetical protein